MNIFVSSPFLLFVVVLIVLGCALLWFIAELVLEQKRQMDFSNDPDGGLW